MASILEGVPRHVKICYSPVTAPCNVLQLISDPYRIGAID